MNSKVASKVEMIFRTWSIEYAKELVVELEKVDKDNIDWKERFKAESELMAELLLNYVNGSGHAEEAFMKKILSGHRQLQALIFRLFLKVIEVWSKETRYDGRNEWVIKKSREIVETMALVRKV